MTPDHIQTVLFALGVVSVGGLVIAAYLVYGIENESCRLLAELASIKAENELLKASIESIKSRAADAVREHAAKAEEAVKDLAIEAREAREQWATSQRELWEARVAVCEMYRRTEALKGIVAVSDRFASSIADAAREYQQSMQQRN